MDQKIPIKFFKFGWLILALCTWQVRKNNLQYDYGSGFLFFFVIFALLLPWYFTISLLPQSLQLHSSPVLLSLFASLLVCLLFDLLLLFLRIKLLPKLTKTEV